MFSPAEENHIKSIWHLQQMHKKVTTNLLAERMQTKPASITDMVKKLEAKKLVHYEKYYGCSLTPEGRKLALGIIRKHRLWEYFLSEKLGFAWDEVHAVAEQLEHIDSPLLTQRLDAYLGHPSFDPHGDPIPDEGGNLKQQAKQLLAEWPVGKPGTICAVENHDASFLEMLAQKSLDIGTVLQVKSRYAFDQSADLKLKDGSMVTVSSAIAKNIYLKEQ